MVRVLPCLILLTSCTISGRVSTGTRPSPSGVPPTPAEASIAKRYVAVLEDPKDCASVSGWDASLMFASAAAAPRTSPPDPRGRFCVFSWNGPGVPDRAPAMAKAARMDADRDIAVPQAPVQMTPSDSLRTLRKTQAQQVREALGAMVPTDAQAPAHWPYLGSPAGSAPPYVAVVDTADSSKPGAAMPRYYDTDAAQHHGLMMRALVEAIRCPYESRGCRDRQFFVQAMPYDADHHTPQPSGGRRGSLGSLAVAIDQAVDDYKALSDSDRSGLIINLSVGWDIRSLDVPPGDEASRLLEVVDDTIPSVAQAVYISLARARCEGALIIAASGNHLGQPCRELGPMGPAAWERLDAPADCHMFGSAASPVGPLVYAAGGLDEYDQPIANSRIDSLPRRALYAHKAVLPAEERFTQPWTGTSVATASLSAIAAAVWTEQPDLRPDEVMAKVDQSGVPLPLEASILPGGVSRGVVHRIDAQAVFAQALQGSANPYQARPELGSATLRANIAARTRVTIYSEPNYQGWSRTVELGSSKVEDLTAGDYPVGSMRVPQGMRVLVALAADPEPQHAVSEDVPALEAFVRSRSEVEGDSVVELTVELEHSEAPVCDGLDTEPLDDLSVETRPQPHVPVCPTCQIIKSGKGSVDSNSTSIYTVEWDFTWEQSANGLSSQDSLSGIITFTAAGQTKDAVFSIDSSRGSYQLSSEVATWLDQRPMVRAGHFRVTSGTGSSQHSASVSIDGSDVISIEG